MASTGSRSAAGTTPQPGVPAGPVPDPPRQGAPSGRGDADLAHHREADREHITEEELPRAGQVCALAPVEVPIPGDNLD